MLLSDRVGNLSELLAVCVLTCLTGLAVPLVVAAASGSNFLVFGLTGVGATVVSIRWPVVPVAALLASTLLFNDQALLTTGFPGVGLTIVDVLVLSLIPLVMIRAVYGGQALSSLRDDRIMTILVTLLALGSVHLIVGVIQEAPLRTALRDYRLFVYVPVVYCYVRLTISNVARGLAVGLGWYVLVVAQFGSIVAGWLVLYDMPGSVADIFPTTADTSAWHFLGAQSFFPFFCSAAQLLGGLKLRRREIILHALVIGVWSLVLLLSFNRTLWITVAASTLGLAYIDRSTLLRKATRPLIVFVAATAIVGVTLLVAGSVDVLHALPQRAVSIFDFRTDQANLTRLADIAWTAERVLYAPLGHGLGTGDIASGGFYFGDYRLGAATHMGYLWLAYRAGIVATVLFMMALAIPIARAFENLESGRIAGRWSRWHRGAAAALIAMAIGATAGTGMVDFSTLPYWGLLLGLQYAFKPPLLPQSTGATVSRTRTAVVST